MVSNASLGQFNDWSGYNRVTQKYFNSQNYFRHRIGIRFQYSNSVETLNLTKVIQWSAILYDLHSCVDESSLGGSYIFNCFSYFRFWTLLIFTHWEKEFKSLTSNKREYKMVLEEVGYYGSGYLVKTKFVCNWFW